MGPDLVYAEWYFSPLQAEHKNDLYFIKSSEPKEPHV